VDWMSLISGFLIPMFAQCLNRVSSETPEEYLRPHYDPITGKMDPELVTDAMSRTKRAIRKAYNNTPKKERGAFPRYSRDEVYAITEAKLIEAMNAPPEAVAAAMASAATLGDD